MEDVIVKTIRQSILNSLLEVACQNQDNPSCVPAEMRQFLDVLCRRPAMQHFFQLYDIPHDEFIRDVYETAVSMTVEKSC